MLTPELKKQVLDAAAVRLAGHPPALAKLRAQLEDGTFPRQASVLLLLDAHTLKWAIDTNYADRKLVAIIDDWVEQSDNIEPRPVVSLLPDFVIDTFPADPNDYTPKQRRSLIDITQERGSRRMILEHWDQIELVHGGGADGRQVLRFLKRCVSSSEKHPALKTVQNHLCNLRKEKLLP
jgi:hypothetical protein